MNSLSIQPPIRLLYSRADRNAAKDGFPHRLRNSRARVLSRRPIPQPDRSGASSFRAARRCSLRHGTSIRSKCACLICSTGSRGKPRKSSACRRSSSRTPSPGGGDPGGGGTTAPGPGKRPITVSRSCPENTLAGVAAGMPAFPDEQKRVVAATVGEGADAIRVVCAYVPNGQAVGSENTIQAQMASRLSGRWLEEELKRTLGSRLLGDYNIAPADEDVYDRSYGKVRSCAAPETGSLSGSSLLWD